MLQLNDDEHIRIPSPAAHGRSSANCRLRHCCNVRRFDLISYFTEMVSESKPQVAQELGWNPTVELAVNIGLCSVGLDLHTLRTTHARFAEKFLTCMIEDAARAIDTCSSAIRSSDCLIKKVALH